MKKCALLSILPGTLTLMATEGSAQTILAQANSTTAPSSAATTDSQAGQESDIVVTAQRRSQRLQDVPISITSVAAETLTEEGIDTISGLETLSPGLSVTRQRGAITPYLRGVGSQNSVPGEEGTVPVYIDGVLVISLLAANFSLPNIERVEILRGPQGTLFGRNAVGGLIHVITRDPSHVAFAEGTVSFSNYDTVSATAYATGGITDTLALDFSAHITDQGEGWGRNLTLGNDVNLRDEWAIRSRILFTPANNLSIIVAGDYSDRESDLGATRAIFPGAVTVGGFRSLGTIYDTRSNSPLISGWHQWGISARINYDLDFAELTSTTAYRRLSGALYYDQDATPLRISESPLQGEYNKSFQQEVLLVGSGGGALDWTLGLFYLSSDARLDLVQRSDLIPPQNFDSTNLQETRAYSAFGQITYRILDDTSITAGLRYTREERRIYAQMFAAAGFPGRAPGQLIMSRDPSTDPGAELTFGKLTWRFAIDHHFTPDVMAYASYNRGFKSGSFNGSNPFEAPVDPEQLDAYEIGLRSTFFNRRVRFNTSAFHYDYKNIQIIVPLAGPPSILNAASGDIDGVEFEMEVSPPVGFGDLSLNASLSILDATYSSFPNGPFTRPLPQGGNQQLIGDLTGRDMIRTPPVTVTVGARYTFPVSMGEVRATVSYYYNDGFFWEPDNRLRQESYGLLNASVALAGRGDRWVVSLFGSNLTDERYYSWLSGNSIGDLAAPSEPRTYGVSLRLGFGG